MADDGAIKKLRTAILAALSGNIGYSVYDIPPGSAGDHVTISAVRSHETTAQTWFSYEAYVTIDIVSQYQKQGNRNDGYAEADKINDILRPSVTGFIAVSGFDVCGCWLDDQYESLSNEPAGKYHKLTLIYYFNLIES